eukprot:TRINITY_DN3926_c0_g1_i8.p1 TRINITY_DN3926_c0_g1~~TRINITY_DN3926_c0_g1_i8.p1  ORF type:complete len:285 (-),score=54.06 TRINITY_DN3926_c0_g1_i8:84-938(-)
MSVDQIRERIRQESTLKARKHSKEVVQRILKEKVSKKNLPSPVHIEEDEEYGNEFEKVYVRTLYGYTAQSPQELSFHVGEYFVCFKRDKSGWWKGLKGGIMGVFPANYVEVVDKDEVPFKSKTKEELQEEMQSVKSDLFITQQNITQTKTDIITLGSSTTKLWADTRPKTTLNCEFYGLTPIQELLYDVRCLIAMLEVDLALRNDLKEEVIKLQEAATQVLNQILQISVSSSTSAPIIKKHKNKLESLVKNINSLQQDNTSPGQLHKALCVLEQRIGKIKKKKN